MDGCAHTEKGQAYLDRTIKCPRQTTQDEYPHITGLLEFYSFRKEQKTADQWFVVNLILLL